MRASKLWRVISRVRNILEGSIKAWIEDLDVNFYITYEGNYTLDDELRYVVKIKNAVFLIKEKCFWRVTSWHWKGLKQSIKAHIEDHFL